MSRHVRYGEKLLRLLDEGKRPVARFERWDRRVRRGAGDWWGPPGELGEPGVELRALVEAKVNRLKERL